MEIRVGVSGCEHRGASARVDFWRVTVVTTVTRTHPSTHTPMTKNREPSTVAPSRARPVSQAVIYRRYRDGELPDIQIKLGDVLRPLQHLCMLDGGIAKEVFVQIFKVRCRGPVHGRP